MKSKEIINTLIRFCHDQESLDKFEDYLRANVTKQDIAELKQVDEEFHEMVSYVAEQAGIEFKDQILKPHVFELVGEAE